MLGTITTTGPVHDQSAAQSDCTVYIDEAGDLGIRRGTRWFILTAVIVKKSDEPMIRNRMNVIKTRLNVREIHMRSIADFNKRSYIVHELREMPFVYMNVVVDTDKFDVEKIPNPTVAYNYACRQLLERVSGYLRDAQLTADVVLSSRGTSRDGELIEYITDKLLPYPHNAIDGQVFGKISAKSAAMWDMLQLADICTTSLFLAYEINAWGMRTPCLARKLKPHLYSKNGKIDRYGIKYLVEDMRPEPGELDNCWPCQTK